MEQLLLIRDKGFLVQVVTTLRTYNQMGVVSFVPTRDVNSANSLVFTIGLKEVRLGSTVTEPAPLIPTKKVNKGAKPTEKSEETVQDPGSAIANIMGVR
jgi:hypothetical protein